MDRLWSPWRYQYVSQPPAGGCLFCTKAAEQRDQENYVVYRAERNFVILNLYPYTSGHLMIAPYEHVAALEDAAEETLLEMMTLTRLASRALRSVYNPRGLNIGMNVGECAGAGVAAHIHMHVLPRWPADASFITTVGETRVIPEALPDTYRRLAEAFRKPGTLPSVPGL